MKLAESKNRPSAIFLDRDGTLIEDVGYLSKPEDVIWFPDTIASLRRLQRRFMLFVVSNQSGVAIGRLTIDEVTAVNQHIDEVLKAKGIHIKRWYVCPHSRADRCRCMKPAPYFLNAARDAFNLDLGHSFTLGDHLHDVRFGESVGAKGLYLLTGHGAKHRHELPHGMPVYQTLTDATDFIMESTSY